MDGGGTAGRRCCGQHRVPHTASGPWPVTRYSHTPLDTAMMSSTSPWVRPPLAAWGPRKEGRHRQALRERWGPAEAKDARECAQPAQGTANC